MSVPERRLFVLIRAWRSLAVQYERGYGLGDGLPAEEREAHAETWRRAAQMLEEGAGLCAACTGRGLEFVEEFEGDPARWVDCGFCRGSGRSGRPQCAECARLEDEDFTVVHLGAVWCSGCARADEAIRSHQARNGEPVTGLAGAHVWEPPFGAHG